jgi:hypothetical protein
VKSPEDRGMHLAKDALHCLIGLPLSAAQNAGNMKMFHFGEMRRLKSRFLGEIVVHVQCPWRLQDGERLVTGSDDFYVRADDNPDEAWEPGSVTGHLQNQLLRQMLKGYDESSGSFINATRDFVVTAANVSGLGNFEIDLSPGYKLIAFPTSARTEYWRLFSPGSSSEHLVVAEGTARFD